MYELRGLTIDNGGSQVRGLPLGKTVKDGMFTLSNDFVCIPQNNFRIKDTEDKLGLCNIIKAPKNAYIGIIARGTTGKMYSGDMIKLDNTKTKTSNINYFKQFIFAVARDAIDAKLDGVSELEQPIEVKRKLSFFKKQDEVGVAQKPTGFYYVITTCIPIKEHSGDEDCSSKLKEALAGEYEVIFPLLAGDNKVKFIIDKKYTGVVPEGGVAIAGLRKDIDKEDFSILSDLGHVTHDLAIYKGITLYGKPKSSRLAGSILEANVMDALSSAGYAVSDDQIGKIIETGQAMKGKKSEDVSNIVREQKRLFAVNSVKDDILQLLRLNSLDPQQIQNFVPMGAPMNVSRSTGALANVIAEATGLSNTSMKLMADDLRYVNIEQASMFNKMLFAKAVQEIGLFVAE